MKIQKSNFKLTVNQKLIGFCLFTLAAILPIQNILVVFAVNVLVLPSWLALWKEILVLVLIVWMKVDLLKNIGLINIKYKWFLNAFVILNLLVLFSSFILNNVPLNQFILSYRFELFWLWLWVFGFVWVKNITNSLGNRGVEVYETQNTQIQFYKRQLAKGFFLGFGLCLIFTLGHIMIGKDFVQFFGYTDSSLQLSTGKINSPICHPIDFGIDSCRLAAPFSSPNHLAGYLTFILGFILLYAVKRSELKSIRKNIYSFKFSKLSFPQILHDTISALTNYHFIPISIIISIFIFLTYSRFALIVLALYWIFVLIYIFKQSFSKNLTIIILLFTLIFSLLVTSFDPSWTTKSLPTFLAKPSSSLEHYSLTGVSLDILKSEPEILLTGLGQGSSGSSTTYFQPDQNVIYNRFRDISYKWFIKPERITVPENWYLQLTLNGGLIYTLLYLFMLIYPLTTIIKNSESNFRLLPVAKGLAAQAVWGYNSDTIQVYELKNRSYQNLFISISFFGIILGNIFLHLWENQTIAIYWSLIYLWWSLEMGANFPSTPAQSRS
jgi:hypothetical protein